MKIEQAALVLPAAAAITPALPLAVLTPGLAHADPACRAMLQNGGICQSGPRAATTGR